MRLCRFIVLIVLAGSFVRAATERTLTKAIEVRSLSFAEAATGIPVELRGVVVFLENASAVFVQDETSTTFFRTHATQLPKIGDEIAIHGRTRMGLYLPGLDYSTFEVLGHRAMPPGIPARYDDLVFSRYHYQRVAVEGVVRAISALGAKGSLVRLAMGSRVLEAQVEAPSEPNRVLVDYKVRITGLAVGVINKRRQLVQPYLRVSGWDEVEVMAPAPPVSEVPAISAEELLAFRVSGHGEQRVRIGGTVTAVLPNEQVFLRQDNIAFAVRLAQPASLAVGDDVAVVGFPEMDRSTAAVVDAEIVRRQAGVPPEPIALASPDRIDDIHDAALVRVTGAVRDSFKTDDGVTLLLDGKGRTVQARIPSVNDPPAIGTIVAVTGIAQVELSRSNSGFSASTGIVTLRGRSADDLGVLRAPPWWTVRRLGLVLAALAGIVALAFLWIAILRRQVDRQTTALRERIESEATLEERQRIARDFHDTLEQELAGVSLRLDALATRQSDEKGRQLVSASRNLVSRIQAETRDLIGDLRDTPESAGDLRAALGAVAERQTGDSGVEIRFASAGVFPRVEPRIVHDLRMVARESVTNAVKHGQATRVEITLEGEPLQLVLRVRDNGRGFDPATAQAEMRGHFGCAGMRERARKIGANITWDSRPSEGTTVVITLALAANGQARGSAGAALPA